MQNHQTLRGVSCGTEPDVAQEAMPAVIAAETCYPAWQESLLHLARLFEPDVPGWRKAQRKRA